MRVSVLLPIKAVQAQAQTVQILFRADFASTEVFMTFMEAPMASMEAPMAPKAIVRCSRVGPMTPTYSRYFYSPPGPD